MSERRDPHPEPEADVSDELGDADRANGSARGMSQRRLLSLMLAGLLVVIAGTVAAFVLTRNATDGTDDGNPDEPAALQPGWQRRGSINNPRDDFATLVINGKIWIGGGMTGERGNKLNSTEWYDPAKDRWSVGESMPTARSSLVAGYVDGVIYAIGGARLDRPYLAVNEAYDVATGLWTGRAAMPTARYESAVAVLDGKIWVIGGKAESGPTGVVEIYDPAADSWSTGPSLQQPRSALRAAVLGGKIYAVGGLIEGGSVTTVEVYDPAVGSWQPGPELPTALSNTGLGLFNDQIHVIYHQYHYVLDPGATRWLIEEAPPIHRHGLGLAQLGEALFAIGGCTEEPLQDINIVQAWVPPDGSITRTPPADQAAAIAEYAALHPRPTPSATDVTAQPLAGDE